MRILGREIQLGKGFLTRSGNASSQASSSTLPEKRSANVELIQAVQSMFRQFSIGTNVNVYQAFGLVTFFACIKRLSQDIATLQIHIYEQRNEGSRMQFKLVTDHPARTLVNISPNAYSTAAEMWENAIAYALFTGFGYIRIVRDSRTAAIQELVFYRSHNVNPYFDINGRLIQFDITGENTKVSADDVLVIKNFLGVNPVTQFNNMLGLSISAEKYAQMYFGNGGSTEGYIASPTGLNTNQTEGIRKNWKEAKAKGDTPMLEYGLEYKVVNGRPVDSELNDTRNSNDKQICRIFGVPPQLVGIDSATKYDSVEAMATHYQKFVLRPFCVKISQELNMKLLKVSERGRYCFEHDLDEINGALEEVRWKRYEMGLKNGVLSINDVREKEGLNPVDGGEIHLVQVNQIDLGMIDEYSKKLAAEGPTSGAAANNQNK